jgi:hypothetical protein
MPYAPLDSDSLFSTAFMAGPLPWAVWTAILASKDKDGLTSLNPEILSRLWQVDLADVQKAWDHHAKPDAKSKNKEHDGARIVPTEDGRWKVVSHEKYRSKHLSEKRRDANTEAVRRHRARKAEPAGTVPEPVYDGPTSEEAAEAFEEPPKPKKKRRAQQKPPPGVQARHVPTPLVHEPERDMGGFETPEEKAARLRHEAAKAQEEGDAWVNTP